MTTLAVLGWQLMIVLTLGDCLVIFLINQERFIVCLERGLFSPLVSLFTSPLIVLQLAVIFMATRILLQARRQTNLTRS